MFENVSEKTICWMSHNDYIAKEAPGFDIIAHTSDCPVAAVQNTEKNLYAVQFHPEVLHTQEGKKMPVSYTHLIISQVIGMPAFCGIFSISEDRRG